MLALKRITTHKQGHLWFKNIKRVSTNHLNVDIWKKNHLLVGALNVEL